MTLAPAPDTLGLESPAIGPWFRTDVTLPVPGDDLGVTLNLTTGEDWLPPAGGLLSLAVATDPRPAVLAGLRGPDGSPAFTTGRLVALFRLLPEVEQRLGALLTLPTVDGTTPPAGTATRATVRWFALELPENPPPLATLLDRIDPPVQGFSSDSEKAGHLGLTQTGGNLGNDVHPMADLKRAGSILGFEDKLLTFPAAATVKLFAFDVRGRPLDPGAVAAWWTSLTTTFNNLWAPGVTQRTATTTAQLGFHLTSPNEAPAHPGVLGRLQATGPTGTGPVRTTTGGANLTLTGGTVDAAPLPRVAVLPAGNYLAAANLWAAGAVGGLTRDFVRVALVDLELQVTGQPRVAGTGASDVEQRRADDQKRTTSQILVAQATTDATETVLLATADAAMAGLVAVLGAGSATLAAPVLDRSAGALAAPTLPSVAPPAALPNAVTMVALTGGGTAAGSTVTNQRVLVQTSFDPSLAGAWLRVWPQYFDSDKGVHERGAGGSGTVDAAGVVRVVVRLADGDVTPDNRMGLDLMLVTATQAMRYAEVRLERPVPVGGTMPTLGSVTDPVVACESGQTFTGGVPAGALPSGSTLVGLSTPPALVDPASVPNAQWNAPTVAAALVAGDSFLLTEPAWKGWRGGETAEAVASGGATPSVIARPGLTRLVQVGAPLPTQARDEVAAAVVTAGVADAVVAAVTPLGVHHELLPHQSGHPGAPGDDERHGTGARLRGPAAVAVAEILRERTAGTTVALAQAAATPLPQPAAPTVPGTWTAVLRTVGFGVEAEPGLTQVLNATGLGAFPFDGTFSDIQTWLSTNGITLPGSTGPAAASVVRAVSRRMLGARSGYREALQAMFTAFARAEDYIYLETPAMDYEFVASGTDDVLRLWQALIDRAAENLALQVVVCLPVTLAPGTPAKLQRVRDKGVLAALAALRTAAGERLAVFTPVTGPGRSLHLDATSVLVDDAWAITGGAHLWRRGLSFDASLAVSAFDERVAGGRPAEVVAFRRALIAGRLGLAANLLPEDPAELVRAIRQLSARGGGLRLSPEPIEQPKPAPAESDVAIWNPDGSPVTGFDPLGWLGGLAAEVQAELAAEVPGSP
ncbi:hypothetical protein [Propioniciclava sp.]|uniref:hypothetical protein n=1 Tax=Propioniciclava sp. TaxID=2038686 RepID=UPI0026201397|nr:hypothetical protein [Propioniciclava sp.]